MYMMYIFIRIISALLILNSYSNANPNCQPLVTGQQLLSPEVVQLEFSPGDGSGIHIKVTTEKVGNKISVIDFFFRQQTDPWTQYSSISSKIKSFNIGNYLFIAYNLYDGNDLFYDGNDPFGIPHPRLMLVDMKNQKAYRTMSNLNIPRPIPYFLENVNLSPADQYLAKFKQVYSQQVKLSAEKISIDEGNISGLRYTHETGRVAGLETRRILSELGYTVEASEVYNRHIEKIVDDSIRFAQLPLEREILVEQELSEDELDKVIADAKNSAVDYLARMGFSTEDSQ